MESIDLFSARFWLLTLIAILLLAPLTALRARRWIFALLNIGFISLFCGSAGQRIPVLLAALVALWVGLHALRGDSGTTKRRLAALAGALLLVGLFFLHKWPTQSTGPTVSTVESVLTTIGFSYVALRVVELGRAIWDRRHPVPDFPAMINYLLPFHMLAAGPIQAYDDFVAQPAVPGALTTRQSMGALERISSGLFKKYVCANLISQLFLTDYVARGPYFLVEAQLKYIWLYLDFSAYSDVAVGIGLLIGVATPENFRRPYVARNIIDFWERWHISLSMFIRRNVFIPLQLALVRRTAGQRPLLAASVAFIVAFLLCGLWHSVSLPWLAWGAYQAMGLIACNLYREFLLKRLGRKRFNQYLANRWIRVLSTVITFEFVAFGIVIGTYPIEEVFRWWSP